MKSRQGAEIPDELIFGEVAESNLMASVAAVTPEEIEMLMDRRIKPSRRLRIFERRGEK